jgi:hypothetical protein
VEFTDSKIRIVEVTFAFCEAEAIDGSGRQREEKGDW